MNLIIVTGLSGAGKSTVMNAMEDIGYFCVDNLPVGLIPVLVKDLKRQDKKMLAVVTDVRAGLTPDGMSSTLEQLRRDGVSFKILFIDCKQDIIHNRFKSSRRTHPLSDECISLADAISIEHKLMQPFRQISDYIIDTSMLHSNSCKSRIFDFFKAFENNHSTSVRIHCVSFGFKHGTPEDADFIFDVRSLPNPYYVDDLRPLTGLDCRVSEFVMSFDEATEYEKRLYDFCDYATALCVKDGRSQLVLAVGCTGGHHRSVTFVERLCKHLESDGYRASLTHRDINK